MKNLGYRLTPSERGALGHGPPEPAANLGDLAHQANDLEERVHHLKTGINNLLQLQQIQPDGNAPHTDLHMAQAELAQLQQAVEEFELELASRTLSWSQLREPFWQAVRYGGLGIVLGWALHWLLRS